MAYYMNQTKEVRRGDIYYIANSKCYATNPENEAGRPGIVVSCDELNENSPSVEVVYLTTKDKKPMPTHVPIMCKVCSTALCETIYTVGKDRLGDYVRTCTDTEMSEIDKGMIHSLGISVPYIERERLRKLIHRILPLPLSREIFIRTCTNSFLTRWWQYERFRNITRNRYLVCYDVAPTQSVRFTRVEGYKQTFSKHFL